MRPLRLSKRPRNMMFDAVAPAGEGWRISVLAQVHAVGDDLVLAGEVAPDEMACRRADRDAAVELLREALSMRLPNS